MKKITYQVTLNDDLYKKYISKLTNVVLFPEKGNVIFKVEEICENDKSQPVTVNAINGYKETKWNKEKKN